MHHWAHKRTLRHSARKVGSRPLQKAAVSALSCFCFFACDGQFNHDDDGLELTQTEQRFLESMADQVILPTYQNFLDATNALVFAAEEYHEAVVTEDENQDALRAEVQNEWLNAMTLWQQAEVMQVGPAGPAGMVAGGLSMRDDIYSWPSVNSCAIDQQLVANGFSDANYFDSKLVYVYGLDASEYTLYHTDTSNTCAAPATINASGAWDALDINSLNQRRSAYTLATARHLQRKAENLISAWTSEESDFRGSFVLDPTAKTQEYASADEVINDLFRAMYYIELSVKDLKLASPLGLNENCQGNACPEALESLWAEKDSLYIAHNLIGFQAMLTGGNEDGIGFQGLLEEEGYSDVAADILEKTEEAIQYAHGIEESGTTLLQEEPASLIALYEHVKAVTDIMKNQFTGILNVQIPSEGAGDTD